MKKTEWKKYIKDLVKDLLKTKPEAVYVDGDMFSIYPVVHQLRKKHIPVLTSVTKEGLWMDWMIKSENYTGIIKLSFVKKNVLWHILFDTFRSSNS